MNHFLLKPYRWAAIFSIILIGTFIFVILDSFVIPKPMKTVATQPTAPQEEAQKSQSKAVITDHSYEDDNIKINIETVRQYDTTVYLADIQLTDASYLKTALAKNTYGRNINEKTTDMMKEHKGILAINGDYYGFRDNGYVLRNGVLYRDKEREADKDEALAINKSGDFSIIQENQIDKKTWKPEDFSQILSFGPVLIKDSKIVVDEKSEVNIVPYLSGDKTKKPPSGPPIKDGKPMPPIDLQTHPRTAIGQISPLHYLFIVADGRTEENAGLSLLNLAKLFEQYKCTFAYNLDGGGSSTMYFNGEIINSPTDGRIDGEREVSDVIYIGY